MAPLRCLLGAALALTLFGAGGNARAQEDGKKPGTGEAAGAAPEAPPKETSSVTQHGLTVDGRYFDYTATAGTLLLRDDKQEPTASLFYVAYTKAGVTDLSRRPIAFLYNGGPGSASVWLHLGAFGPRRVLTDDAGATPPPPYRLVDNAYTLLDRADLVFIDAVGSGFSRAVGKAKDQDFWGIDADVRSFGQFIELYCSRNHRWNSPKYLIGESYGTFRSAALVDYLQDRKGMDFNGVVLISSTLDMGSLTFAPGDDRDYVFYLPSYAAAAYYHHRLKDPPSDLAAFLAEARRFAAGDYAAALQQGDALSAADKAAMARRLSAFTGLSEDYLVKADLRVSVTQFMEELQRSGGRITGRLDTRFSGYNLDLLGEYADYDPLEPAIFGAFTAVFNGYVRDDLKFKSDREYRLLNPEVMPKWDWKREPPINGDPRITGNVEPDLAEALAKNPNLQVEVENGLYELATPFFATEYTLNHLGLPEALRGHIHLNYYEAGHMMYLREDSLAELKKNIAAFIDRTKGT